MRSFNSLFFRALRFSFFVLLGTCFLPSPGQQGSNLSASFHATRSQRQATPIQKILSRLSKANLAMAGGSAATNNVINAVRGNYGEIMGYADHASYVALVCNGVDPGVGVSCDGPPEDGIVGALADIMNATSTIMASAGYANCAAVPTSGTATGTDSAGASYALTFQAATHSSPASWLNPSTKFEKRVQLVSTISNEVTTIAFEYSCGGEATYTAVNMAMPNAPGYTRLIEIYTGQADASNAGFEVYLAEYDATSDLIRGVAAVRVYHDDSAQTFQMWGVFGGNVSDTVNMVLKTSATGNYAGKASVFFDGLTTTNGGSGYDVSATNAYGSANSDQIAATADFDMASDISSVAAGTELLKQGCIDFTAPDTAATSTTACSGLSLVAPTGAPAVDASGKFSPTWALSIGPKLEVL